MQKSLFYKSRFNFYLIPILLLVFSFAIYSYNLEGTASHGDEIVYLGWGGPYFDLILQGDFANPCLKGLKDCNLLYDPDWAGHDVNYSPIRNFFVGFGYYITTGEIKGDFYEWSCMFFSCWDDKNFPSPEEFESGRFFSPVFGSLTIVLAFLIGKILFNRTTGLFFSLSMLFYSYWLINSRLMMTEVYLHFFIFLSIFLLLKSFKKQNNLSLVYFILGSISFGFALNTKIFAIELIIPIVVMILFYDSFNEKLNFRFFKNTKNIVKSVTLVFIFFLISSSIFIATVPRFHDDTFDKIAGIQGESKAVGYASLPNEEKNYLFLSLATLQVSLLPYFMDSYIHEIFSEEAQNVRLTDTTFLPNYSTIPISLFFFIGLIYIAIQIKSRNLKFSEFVILVWFTSLFIFTLLIVDQPSFERYYLPLMLPILLVASYALGKFIKELQNQKEKILFFMSFIIAHSLYVILFFNRIYFSSTNVNYPFFDSQFALTEPLVYVSTIIFVVISFLLFIKTKMKIPLKHD